MENGIRNIWERNKALAEILLKENKQVYIKDSQDNIYFADIILVGDNSILIQCFGPPQRNNQKITLYWPLITELKIYERRGNDL